jgi:hypothetical protein
VVLRERPRPNLPGVESGLLRVEEPIQKIPDGQPVADHPGSPAGQQVVALVNLPLKSGIRFFPDAEKDMFPPYLFRPLAVRVGEEREIRAVCVVRAGEAAGESRRGETGGRRGENCEKRRKTRAK